MNARKREVSNSSAFVSILLVASIFCTLVGGCVFSQYGKSNSPSRSDVPEKPAKTIVGSWKSDEATVEIRANGKATINGELYNYEINGSTMTITGNDGTINLPFKLNGDTLIFTVQGREVVYTRIGGTGVTEDNDSKNGRTDEPVKTGAGNPPELVGKWCYMSNVQANDGGRMSNMCFTLNQDGTYTYYGETSSSNPNGGTSSQSSDSGRWSATATTLTAQSNTGETKNYTLEKRNHPKNGDPMLIVDGDAYVTAYQKQPW